MFELPPPRFKNPSWLVLNPHLVAGFFSGICWVSKFPSLKLTAFWPLQTGLNTPKGNDRLSTINFQVLLLMAEILHQLIGSLSHYLRSFIHPRWCRISAINSMLVSGRVVFGGYSSYWMMINPYIPSLKYSLRGIQKKRWAAFLASRVPSGKLIIAMENPHLFLVNTIKTVSFPWLCYRSV